MTALWGPAGFEPSGALTGFSVTGTAVGSSALPHTGSWAALVAANNGAVNFLRRGYTTVAKGTRVFKGVWANMNAAPVTNDLLLSIIEHTSFGSAAEIVVKAGTGVIQLRDSTSTPIITGPAIVPGAYTNIEYSCRIPVAGTTDTIQLIVNGVDYGSASATVGSNQMNQTRTGQVAGASTGITALYVDDLQINDDTGASDNSWPSGFTPAVISSWAAVV